MIQNLRSDSYSHLIRLPIPFFNKKRVGELSSRLAADITLVQEAFTVDLAELLRQILTILLGVTFLCFYSYKLTLVMLCTLPVMMIVAVIFGKYIKGLSKNAQDEVAKSNTIIEETLTGIQNVKAFIGELREIKRYKTNTEVIRKIAMKGAKWRGLFASFIIFCMFGAIVVVIWYGAVLKSQGEITTGDLFSFVLYSVFVGASFGGVADIYSNIQKAIGATENVFNLFDEETEYEEVESSNASDKFEKLEVDNLKFTYPNRKESEVLKGISLSINKGETMALVGNSGSGKSTFLSLLYRFYKINPNQILINGKDINDEDLGAHRNRFAFVSQEVLLFGGSIEENIRYGNPDATLDMIKEAARTANALEFIEGFPEGFDTIVGERGIQLSGGQRQRVAIARAVLKNPEILLLDEATSSLDSESEKEVQKALDRVMENRTTIVVAHRLSTIKNADKIVVMQDGQIKETGNHDDLMNSETGIYKNLKDLQMN
jgi:ABC-type multidrug transport system fused ATPase/permease subunit